MTKPHMPLANRARIVAFGLETEGMHWRMEVAWSSGSPGLVTYIALRRVCQTLHNELLGHGKYQALGGLDVTEIFRARETFQRPETKENIYYMVHRESNTMFKICKDNYIQWMCVTLTHTSFEGVPTSVKDTKDLSRVTKCGPWSSPTFNEPANAVFYFYLFASCQLS